MTTIPVSWLSYCDDNPARGRWDQAFLDRMLDGEEWRVPGGFTFETIPWDPNDGLGRVIVFPCGHYAEHGERDIAAGLLQKDLAKLPWAVLIATSDEADRFEWHKFALPPHVKLWVQSPRPESIYPEGTFFHPVGSPTSPLAWSGWHEKTVDVFFAGQVNHVRREDCVTELFKLQMERQDLLVEVLPTEGFTQGLPIHAYREHMRAARIVPCPAGVVSQDTFRFYEALEAGAIPIADRLRPDGTGEGFWDLLFHDVPAPSLASWDDLSATVEFLGGHLEAGAQVSAAWQQYKRSIVYKLHEDVAESISVPYRQRPEGPEDEITVVIVTSPVPSNPSLEIITETITSVQERLPGAEIHILIDGVRPEQSDRATNYWEFARRLTAMVNADPTIVPYVHATHHHQSAMFRHALNRINTRYVMFVEHDTPLVGDIDFSIVTFLMQRDDINLVRFMHDVGITEGSEHLYLETKGTAQCPYLRTVQWSQRPHVARTNWYRDLMATYFGWESRTMIEDVMHGAVQHAFTGNRTAVRKGWQKWKLAVWAPPGDSIKFSTHLDGRKSDPKYDMRVAYDAGRPDGGPQEGIIR